MPPVTIINERTHTVEGSAAGDRLLLPPDRLSDALGWELKPEGLCRQDTCVPVRDSAPLFVGGDLDVAAVAGALGRAVVVDAEAGIAAMSLDAEDRRQALEARHAPPFSLNDLEGRSHDLAEWRGRKKLLVAFASW
jgi:hypothetical protein